jgi:8-oxo-dGTP pyrophosphatase MutT (NUDIX family)
MVSNVHELRTAATVIVLRDTAAGPEVLMVRRHHAVAFMAGAHVFPGGRVDPSDHEGSAEWCEGFADAQQRISGVTGEDAAAFHVAGVRELFEESGVLLARTTGSTFVSLAAADAHARFSRHRADVHNARRTLKDVVVGEGLRLALDALVYFAHWVTPPIDIRRFDTCFFVTRVPSEQAPAHDATELSEDVWMTPADALAAGRRGSIALPPPTWTTLRELEGFTSVDATIAWARARDVRSREPKVVEENGRRRLFLPGDPRHPDREPVGSETRFVLVDGGWRPETIA